MTDDGERGAGGGGLPGAGLPARLGELLAGAIPDRLIPLADTVTRMATAARSGPVPGRRADALDVALDAIRDRLLIAARDARLPRVERRRLTAALAGVETELERLAPRLPSVRTQALRSRIAAYRTALAQTSFGRSGSAPTRSQEAAVLAGTAATGWTALQVVPVAAGGPALGTIAAAGAAAILALRRRTRTRVRQAVIQAVHQAEAELPRLGEQPLAELSRALHELLDRADDSGRMTATGRARLTRIGQLLDELLERSATHDLDSDVVHLIRASVTDYLPDTLEPFLALPDPQAVVGGRMAADEVAEQLARLETALEKASQRSGRDRALDQLEVQGEFLRGRFRHE